MKTALSRRTRWTIAVVLSLFVHAGIGLGLWHWPTPVRVSAAAVTMVRDGKGNTMRFLLDEPGGSAPGEGDGVLDYGPLKPPLMASPVPEKPSEFGTQNPGSPAAPATPATQGNSGVGSAGQSGAGQGVGKGDGSFFRIPARGQRIVYLLDGSASMGQNSAWSIAARELVASLRGLPAGTRFRVLVYNNSARLLIPRLTDWLEPTPEIVREIEGALAMTPVEGRTDHLPALRDALALGPDVLYFLTDADDLQGEHLRQVQQLNQGRTIIHTIELTAANRNRPGMPLQMLAATNRGMYQAVDVK